MEPAALPLEQSCWVMACSLVDGAVVNILQEHPATLFFYFVL
jgi:hypothetical protein